MSSQRSLQARVTWTIVHVGLQKSPSPLPFCQIYRHWTFPRLFDLVFRAVFHHTFVFTCIVSGTRYFVITWINHNVLFSRHVKLVPKMPSIQDTLYILRKYRSNVAGSCVEVNCAVMWGGVGEENSIFKEGELGHKMWPAPRYWVCNAIFQSTSRLLEKQLRSRNFATGHLKWPDLVPLPSHVTTTVSLHWDYLVSMGSLCTPEPSQPHQFPDKSSKDALWHAGLFLYNNECCSHRHHVPWTHIDLLPWSLEECGVSFDVGLQCVNYTTLILVLKKLDLQGGIFFKGPIDMQLAVNSVVAWIDTCNCTFILSACLNALDTQHATHTPSTVLPACYSHL